MARVRGMTNIDQEIKERLEYFEDWIEKHPTREQTTVVNDRTAREYIRTVFNNDFSLSSLASAMDEKTGSYDQLIRTDTIKSLIEDNLKLTKSGKELTQALAGLKKKRVDLDKSLGARKPKTRRKVVRTILDVETANKYGYNPVKNSRGVIQFHGKNGRFVKTVDLLKVVDLVVASSARKRLQVEKLLEQDFKGDKKE